MNILNQASLTEVAGGLCADGVCINVPSNGIPYNAYTYIDSGFQQVLNGTLSEEAFAYNLTTQGYNAYFETYFVNMIDAAFMEL